VLFNHNGVFMRVFQLNAIAAQALDAAQHEQWRHSVIRHWECLQQAYWPKPNPHNAAIP